MGKSAFDFDDIQAAENRRKEVAVRAGASPRAERYADSPLKKIMREYFDETHTKAEDKAREYIESHPLPGYNFVSNFGEDDKDGKKAAEEAKKASEELQKLMEEANKNEYKVTDTSTGLPKPEPVYTDEQKEEMEALAKRAKAQREKEQAHAATVVVKPASPDAKPGATTDKK